MWLRQIRAVGFMVAMFKALRANCQYARRHRFDAA